MTFKSKSFKDLQNQWYKKLEDSGFEDIEDTRHHNAPLKAWHSFDIPSKRFQLIQNNRAQYQRQIDCFINNPAFYDACKAMVKHGNCKFEDYEVIIIWVLHAEGKTVREIADKLTRPVSRIFDIIKGLREWMKIT